MIRIRNTACIWMHAVLGNQSSRYITGKKKDMVSQIKAQPRIIFLEAGSESGSTLHYGSVSFLDVV